MTKKTRKPATKFSLASEPKLEDIDMDSDWARRLRRSLEWEESKQVNRDRGSTEFGVPRTKI